MSPETQRIAPYEQRLDRDPRWALSEGSEFFEGRGAVQTALRKITFRLNELGIPYAIVGAIAMFHHGYRRFTEDVDILVTREGLRRIHKELEGRGYLPPFAQSKNLRDTEHGVKIDFLVSGGYPGDGKPKPVSFPDPLASSFESDGIRYLDLNALINLKLASGMSSPHRERDLVDIGELIRAIDLPLEYTTKLDSSVQAKYRELWQKARRRFVRSWRNKFLTLSATTLDDMISQLRAAAEELEAMKKDGVVLDPNGGTADDYALLVTADPKIAAKYDMEDESEIWPDGDDDTSPQTET